jgi:hypothetical protein
MGKPKLNIEVRRDVDQRCNFTPVGYNAIVMEAKGEED